MRCNETIRRNDRGAPGACGGAANMGYPGRKGRRAKGQGQEAMKRGKARSLRISRNVLLRHTSDAGGSY